MDFQYRKLDAEHVLGPMGSDPIVKNGEEA